MNSSLIALKKLSKKFSSESVLNEISLEIKKGEFVSILGSSGCGKSTLLRLIAGLEEKSTGEILKTTNLRLSFVFQEPCLLPWLTLEENIALPFQLLNENQKNVQETLKLVNLERYKDFYPHQLSGGMKMRASMGRALVTNPEVLLMDEPFAALDEVTRFKLQDELEKIWREKNMTIVFVTHSVSEATYLSTRVLFLDKVSGNWSGDIKVELGLGRIQSLKVSVKYNDYVTQLSSLFRQDLL